VIGFVAGLIVGLQFALAGFLVLIPSVRNPEARLAVPVVLFTLVFVGWMVLPIFTYGLDETLDPDRLALLPLSRRHLMTGLFLASAVGIAPLCTLLGLSGAIAGYPRSLSAGLVVTVAVVLEFVISLAGARAVTTALSRLLRSRRARDLSVIVLTILVAVWGLLGQGARLLRGSVVGGTAHRAVAVFGWLPPGMLGRSVATAGAGRIGVASLELLPAFAFAVLLFVWWNRNLERLTTTAEAATPRASTPLLPTRAVGDPRLFRQALSFLPRSRAGAVAAKELRYLWREPTLRAQRMMTAIFSVGGIVALALRPGIHRPQMVLASAALVWWFSLNANNQFASDRAAYWTNVVASGDPKSDLEGKNLASLIVAVPIFALVGIGSALVTGGWAYLPLAFCLTAGVIGVAFGFGSVTSVRLAMPMPESTTNLWAVRSGQGCGTGLVLLLAVAMNAVFVLPLVGLVVAGLRLWPALLWVAAPASIVYGFIVYRTGLGLASRWLRDNQPELLESLRPRQAV
jgi:ABC-2 type transport system permease protein